MGQFRLLVSPVAIELTAEAGAYSRHVETVRAPRTDLVFALVPESTIVGVVVQNGVARAGATVRVANQEGLPSAETTASSGADGGFRVSGLPSGSYEIIAQTAEAISRPAKVAVAVADVTAPLELELFPAASLHGRVDVAGEPCPSGTIELEGPQHAWSDIRHDGRARIDGALPGAYQVVVACTTGMPLREELMLPVGTTERAWSVESGLVLSGQVADANGAPLPGVGVSVSALEPGRPGSTCVSDADAEFRCVGLAPGEYEVSGGGAIELATPVRVRLDAASSPRVSLTLAPFGSIRARIELGAHTQQPPPVLASRGEGLMLNARQQDGEFVFERLPLDTYRVFTGMNPEAGVSVSLDRNGQSETIVLAVAPEHELTGSVHDSNGTPVVDAWVEAAPSDPLLALVAYPQVRALTDENGRFVLERLAPGRYDLTTHALDGEGALQNVASDAVDASIRIASGATGPR